MDRLDPANRTTIAYPRRCAWACVVVLVACLGFSGCKSTPTTVDGATIQDSARRMYYEGMQALVDANYQEAISTFQKVAQSPSYVRYAALARLRMGDALFNQDRFLEAAEVYRAFLAQYGSDPNVPYARYRLASCFYHRIPGEWFASPPAYEMDQSLTQQAEGELKGFVDAFPTSRFAADARERLREVRAMLLARELYTADFYEDRERWRAVAWRLDHAIKTYPELAETEALVWRMADAYARAGEDAGAARAYGLYLERFPEGARRDAARDRLEALDDGESS